MIIPKHLYSQIVDIMPIPCVDLIVVDENVNILLLKRKNEPAKGQWWFPGGRIHLGETRRQAAIRKLKEECNLTPSLIEEIGTYDLILDVAGKKTISHGITTLFHIHILDKAKASLSLDEQSETGKWMTLLEWKKIGLHPFINTGINSIKF